MERRPGESTEAYKNRVEERLAKLRIDMDREEKRGTLRLMDAKEHLARAAVLVNFAEEETHPEKSLILFQAAEIHRRHTKRLVMEAEEKEADSV